MKIIVPFPHTIFRPIQERFDETSILFIYRTKKWEWSTHGGSERFVRGVIEKITFYGKRRGKANRKRRADTLGYKTRVGNSAQTDPIQLSFARSTREAWLQSGKRDRKIRAAFFIYMYISSYVCTYPLKRTQFFCLHPTFLDLSRCLCLLPLGYLIHNTYFMPIYRITNTRNEK